MVTGRQIAVLCAMIHDLSGFSPEAGWEFPEGVVSGPDGPEIRRDALCVEGRLASSGTLDLEKLVSVRLAAPSREFASFDRQLFRTYLEAATEEVTDAGGDYVALLPQAGGQAELSSLRDAVYRARAVIARMQADGVEIMDGTYPYSLGFIIQQADSRWFEPGKLYLSILADGQEGLTGPLLDARAFRGAAFDSHAARALEDALDGRMEKAKEKRDGGDSVSVPGMAAF